MKEKIEHLDELESKLKDPFHKQVLELYKEQPSSSSIMEKIISIIEDKKNEIDPPKNSGI